MYLSYRGTIWHYQKLSQKNFDLWLSHSLTQVFFLSKLGREIGRKQYLVVFIPLYPVGIEMEESPLERQQWSWWNNIFGTLVFCTTLWRGQHSLLQVLNFLLLLLLGPSPREPCLAINWTVYSLNVGYPQAGMKGRTEGGTKTNITLEREQSLTEVRKFRDMKPERSSSAGLLQLPPCTDFSRLPNKLPSFLTSNSKDLHRTERMLCFVMSQSSPCFSPGPYLSSKQVRY